MIGRMKGLLIACLIANVASKPQEIEPRQNGACANMPSFMSGDRIVGGAQAPSMIPWQVAITGYQVGMCGGTILDSCTILSAAHCGPFTTSNTIRAGSRSRTSGGQVRGISQVISNNALPYNNNNNWPNNDWIILKLDQPLNLGGDVQAACLPPSSSYLPSTASKEDCWTSGWGLQSSGGSSSPTMLRYVKVPAISDTVCKQAYGSWKITSSMICAGYPGEGGKDACQNDSGGPFVCNENGKAVVAGVVSWGIGCASPNFPGVYARNTAVLSWIQSNMGSCGSAQGGCSNPNWKGDNYCDDGNNNAGCDFDGGDCCGSDVNTTWCSECQCLDPECKDNYSSCPYWAGRGFCTHSYVPFMTSNCKKSCFC